MALAEDVMQRSAVFMNDPAQTVWNNTVLLPFLQTAHDELQDVLTENGIPVTFEVAANIAVLSGIKILSPLPNDFVAPINLEERPSTSTNDSDFIPIIQVALLPSDDPTQNLRYWDWSGQNIRFIGATLDKTVRLRYLSLVGSIQGDSSAITVTGSFGYLAARTAALAARDIGQNPTRADSLDVRASLSLKRVINREVRALQGVPAKRKPFWANRRRAWLLPSR